MVGEMNYPLQLGLAYLLFVGYLVRTLFISIRLPGAVGVIVSGFMFSYFLQVDIFDGRDKLQGLAFFLVLLTAGFEISLADLKGYILLYAMVPATMELLAIAATAHYFMDYTVIEGLVLATTLFCVGDGLIIPKMGEMGKQFPGHPMPRLVFTWAPLEASYALTLFGVMGGLADPAKQAAVSMPRLILANIVRIVATLVFGGAAGAAAGYLIPNRTKALILGKPLFNGSSVEAYLMILAAALGMFGLGSESVGTPMIPMGFAPGSLLQPELLVIVVGSFFAHVADPKVLHELEVIVGGVWVFGQLVLFSMLGSKTDVNSFSVFGKILPLMAAGLTMRFLGIFIVTFSTLPCRPCNCSTCIRANRASAFADACFCCLAMCPRATIQGALGQQPLVERFFANDPARAHVRLFISAASRLYIVVCSVVGSVLLDAIGPRLLQSTLNREQRCENAVSKEEKLLEEGWKQNERRLTLATRDEAERTQERRLEEKRGRALAKLRGQVKLSQTMKEAAGKHQEAASRNVSSESLDVAELPHKPIGEGHSARRQRGGSGAVRVKNGKAYGQPWELARQLSATSSLSRRERRCDSLASSSSLRSAGFSLHQFESAVAPVVADEDAFESEPPSLNEDSEGSDDSCGSAFLEEKLPATPGSLKATPSTASRPAAERLLQPECGGLPGMPDVAPSPELDPL